MAQRRKCVTQSNGRTKCYSGSAKNGGYVRKGIAKQLMLHKGEIIKAITPALKRKLAKSKTASAARRILSLQIVWIGILITSIIIKGTLVGLKSAHGLTTTLRSKKKALNQRGNLL